MTAASSPIPDSTYTSDLEERVRELEKQVAELKAKLEPLLGS
jgi:uncharacterized protein YceH (UPF0502 family)